MTNTRSTNFAEVEEIKERNNSDTMKRKLKNKTVRQKNNAFNQKNNRQKKEVEEQRREEEDQEMLIKTFQAIAIENLHKTKVSKEEFQVMIENTKK